MPTNAPRTIAPTSQGRGAEVMAINRTKAAEETVAKRMTDQRKSSGD
jgi:hypothetical protein